MTAANVKVINIQYELRTAPRHLLYMRRIKALSEEKHHYNDDDYLLISYL